MKITETKSLSGAGFFDLSRQLNQAIAKGWQPYGTPVVNAGLVFMLIVKYEESPPEAWGLTFTGYDAEKIRVSLSNAEAAEKRWEGDEASGMIFNFDRGKDETEKARQWEPPTDYPTSED
jgi:hypothetical protein